MIIEATILVPPFHMYYFDVTIAGWSVIPTSGGTKYIKKIDDNGTGKDYLDSLEDLNNILLCCFLDDFAPRKIDSILVKTNTINTQQILKIQQVFGAPKRHPKTRTQLAFESSFLSNEIFGKIQNDPHYSPNIELILEWFSILEQNKSLKISLKILMDAFIIINEYFNNQNYFNPVELLNGIILMISSLEGIFLSKQENHADLKFKFPLVGSIYYERFVTNEMLEKFGDQYKKFSQKDFRKILAELYDIRSYIAHGEYAKLLKLKTWKKLLDKKNVHYNELFTEVHFYKAVSMALCLFEKHIFSLILGAKEDLLKGANIIDDIILK
ncbi:MAG: hypothetical protein HQ536_03435 [Parcubacteria group bacterium]|nr:hypothetical protein [Parcubacteria group bacterium]